MYYVVYQTYDGPQVVGPFDTEEEAEEMRRCMGGMQMRPVVVKEVT